MLKTYEINEIKNIKIHGRRAGNVQEVPLFWTHSGIEVNCTGSELWVDLEADCKGFEPWVVFELNHSCMMRQMLLPETKSVCLFRNMQPGKVKNVKFYRDLQAVNGDDSTYVVIKGLRTDGEFLPVEDGKIKIEFVGDSITSGEGTYGAFEDEEWLAMYMSSSRTYVNQIERALKAETRAISHGGWGVYVGWDNDIRNNIPSIYKKVCGISKGPKQVELGSLEDYDFSSWKPDVIVVNLGTNDASSFNQPPLEIPGIGQAKMRKNADGSFLKEDSDKIYNAVTGFLKMIRECNPNAHIIWAYGMLGYDLEKLLKAAVNEYSVSTGDKNVEYMSLPQAGTDKLGSHYHPGFKSHKEVAELLGKHIAELFDLEYRELPGSY